MASNKQPVEGKGTLFPSKKKSGPKAPDWYGEIMINGEVYKLDERDDAYLLRLDFPRVVPPTSLGQQLGLRARDEHPTVDHHVDGTERPMTEHVLQRFTGLQPLQHVVEVSHRPFGGRIVEQGTHADLLASGGAYARLWRMQSGGFKEPGPSDYIDTAPAAE